MTISQERSMVTTVTTDRVEFATTGARRGRDCPWLVQGDIQRADGKRETLLIIAEPTEPSKQGAMCAKFIAAIRDVYAASTHNDPILALTAAIEAANDALYHNNRSTTPGTRVFLGLTCLVMRDHDLIICQVPPTQLILAQNGSPVILPSFDTWRADYQPHTDSGQQGLGAAETATPVLYRAVLEEGDLIVLCSSNLARLLATDDEGDLGPLLGTDPHLAVEYLHNLAERNGLDPAYAAAINPQFAAGGTLSETFAPGQTEEEGWDEPLDQEPARQQGGERWLERSLREMRDWSGIIPWPRRGGGRIVPLHRSRGGPRSLQDDLNHDPLAHTAPLDDDLDDTFAPPAPQEFRATAATAPAPEEYDEQEYADLDDGDRGYESDERDDAPPAYQSPRVAGRAANKRGGIGQALGAAVAFVVLIFGSALERLLPPCGRRQNERFLERSRNRVWPLGNLERHGASRPRMGSTMPLIALVILVALGITLTVSVRNRQIRGEQQRFDAALANVATQREAALGTADKLAAYNRLLVLPESLNTIVGADKPGRPERIAAERTAIVGALDQVAGVERLPPTNIQVVAPLTGATGASGARPQVVASGGQQFVLRDGTVYSVDSRAQTLVRLLGKGDTISGVSVGQIVGITWRVDTLFAFTETHGFVRTTTGWTTMPLAATGRKASAVESFDGNLYFLEPERGQIVKFASGSFAQTPQPWSSTRATTDLSLAVDFAIDMDIYILLSDGRVLDYFQGELKTSFAPVTVPPFAGTSAITIAPEGRWIYLVDPKEGRIMRLGRDGNLANIYKPVTDAPALTNVRDIAIDESTGTLYLLTDAELIAVRLP